MKNPLRYGKAFLICCNCFILIATHASSGLKADPGPPQKTSPAELNQTEIDRSQLINAITPLVKEAKLLYDKKDYGASARIWEKILVLTEKNLGPSDDDTIFTLIALADLYKIQGKSAKAEQLLRRGLNTIQDIQGELHPNTAELSYSLGSLYRDNRRLEQAEILLGQSLRAYKHTLGAKSTEVAKVLFSLGSIYLDNGQFQNSEPLLAEALAIREQKLEPGSLEIAESLFLLGVLKSILDKHQDAKQLLARSLPILQAKLPNDHPAIASNLRMLGATYQSLGEFREAEKSYAQALKIAEVLYGEKQVELKPYLNGLALSHFSQSKYEAAIRVYSRYILVNAQTGNLDLADFNNATSMLGLSYELLGDFANAELHYLKSLQLSRQLGRGSDLQIVKALDSLGGLYKKHGRLKEAERAYKQLAEIYSNTSSPQARVDGAKKVSNHANTVARLGRRIEAEALFDKYLAIQREELGADSEETINTQINLALNKQNLHKYSEAAEILNSTVEILSRQANPDKELIKTIEIALAYNIISSTASSQVFDDTHAPIREADLLRAEKLVNDYIRDYLVLTRNGFGNASDSSRLHDLAAAKSFLADIYSVRNEFDKSLFHSDQAIRLMPLDKRLDPVMFALYQNNAVAFFFKSMPAEALKAALRAQQILVETSALESSKGMGLLGLIGTILEKMGNWDLYEEIADRSLVTTLVVLGRDATSLPESKRDFQRLTNSKSGLLNDEPKSFHLKKKKAILSHKLSLKGVLLDITRNQRVLANSSDVTRSQVKAIADLESQISSVDQALPVRTELILERNRLESELYKALPSIRLQKITTDQVSAYLPPDGIYIELMLYRPVDLNQTTFTRKGVFSLAGNPAYMAIVLTSDRDIHVVKLGDASQVNSAIATALQASAEGYADADKQWMNVSKMLFYPLLPHLTKAKQWFLSPDGELNRVPFAALPAPQQPTMPLAQAVQLRLLTTGRELVRLQQPAPSGSSAVVMANPSYDRPGRKTVTAARPDAVSTVSQRRSGELGSSRWLPLPATEQEGKQVATLLGTRLVGGPAATTTALQRQQGPRVLHVATHGFFIADQEAPPTDPLRMVQEQAPQLKALRGEDPQLRSGLVLAGANQPDLDPNDDGYLTAAEAVSLDLNGTELVVLSACSTGQGEVRTGEGVYGLQRSLTVAGARSTLLSLWKVDDAATAEFMVRFYKRLKAGEGRADALAAVQAEFRSGSVRGPKGEDWSTPYHWAAWQLVGDWRPIQGL